MADSDIYIPSAPPPDANDIPVFLPIPPPAASSAPTPSPASPDIVLDKNQLSQLQQQGYTKGLAEALSTSCTSFPLRIWVVDNSGSMNAGDGNRLVATASANEIKSVTCTRWKEIQETVGYHAQMAALLRAPTMFRLLNHPGMANLSQEFSIADKGNDMIGEDLRIANNTMDLASPTGVTPLAAHVRTIRAQVESLAPSLRLEGKRVVVVLATDGLPSNAGGISGQPELDEFTEALRSLEGLPIWLVVRLCTDDERVVDFYNNLDNQLELSMEVIDNFLDEAKEMYEANPWINYCLPLHRMREMGFQNRIFDILDERKLTLSEVRDFCMLLFGRGSFDGVPEPEVDFKGFLKALEAMVKKEKDQWHPIKKKLKPLISLKILSKTYGDGTCTIM
jgi:hypothetical protein